MNKDDVIRLAREAGIEPVLDPIEGVFFDCYQEQLEAFAKLVAEHERERCAKFCEEQYEYYGYDHVFAAGIRALK